MTDRFQLIRAKLGLMLTHDDVLSFGQYKDHPVREVLAHDPDYILWLDETSNTVKFTSHVIEDAEEASIEGGDWGDWIDYGAIDDIH